MKRFASTRSLKRASQPGAGFAQCSVGSIDDDGMRYGLTTHAFSAKTISDRAGDREDPVEHDARAARQAREETAERISHRTCSRRQASIFAWSPERRTSGHLPAAELGRPRVVRVLEPAAELLREALELARSLRRARPGSRRATASSSTIAGRSPFESTYGPIEIASVARCSTIRSSKPSKRAESSVSSSSLGELLDDRLRQRPPLRRQRDHALRPLVAVHRLERSGDDVDAQHHARAAAVRLVVDLAGAKRRRVAVVEETQLELRAEHARDRPLLGEPGEGVRDECEDVDSHSGSAKPGAITIRPPSRSTFRTQASTSGSDRPESSSRTSFAG